MVSYPRLIIANSCSFHLDFVTDYFYEQGIEFISLQTLLGLFTSNIFIVKSHFTDFFVWKMSLLNAQHLCECG